MKRGESNKRNAVEHVPSCSAWPPPWLSESCPRCEEPYFPFFPPIKKAAVEPPLPGPPAGFSPLDLPPDKPFFSLFAPLKKTSADVSSWDLPPDLAELWEERVCIMHFDGGLPWPEAERLALADVLSQATADALSKNRQKSCHADPEQSADAVQPDLFAPAGIGPYGRGL